MKAATGVVTAVLKFRRRTVLFHLFVFLIALVGMGSLRQDNSPRVFFHGDSASLLTYEKMRLDFSCGSEILVQMEGEDLWTPTGLAWIAGLEEEIGDWPAVVSVSGPLTLNRALLPYWPPNDITGLRARINADLDGLYGGLVDPQGRRMLLGVEVSAENEGRIIQKLRERISHAPRGVHVDLSGLPLFREAMDQALQRNAVPFFFVLFLLSTIILMIVFGSLRLAAVPLIQVLFCLGLTLAAMTAAGTSLNLINIVLAPLLLVISLSTSVHILIHVMMSIREEESIERMIRNAYHRKSGPIIWTGLTTMAAFGSLVFSDSPPIRSMGGWTAVGIAIMTCSMFTLFPILLRFARLSELKEAVRKRLLRISRWGGACARFAVRYRRLVLLSLLLAVILMVSGAMQLRVNDHFAEYFDAEHPVRVSIHQRQAGGLGVFPVELVLSYTGRADPPEKGFLDTDVQFRLAILTQRLRSLPGIRGAFAVSDLVDAMLSVVLLDGERTRNFRIMAISMLNSIPDGRKLLGKMVTSDRNGTRIRLLFSLLDLQQTQSLLKQVERLAAGMFPGIQTRITGEYPLLISAQIHLIKGLALSFCVTLACVLAVFFLITGDFRFSLKLLVPNLWPIVALTGIMGWFDFPADSASVLTFSVVLGLAVDDTLHTLGYLGRRQERFKRLPVAVAVERMTPAHLITSIFLISGFTACAFSELSPVASMGKLASIGISLALIGDIFLIPALLSRSFQASELGDRGRSSGSSRDS